MKKVAVTGGAGFIGSNLTHRLISEGYEVVVVDDLSTGLLSNVNQEKSIFHQVSITDSQALKNALEGCETIFHLAARGSVPRSIKNPVATHEVNATGTLNVLEAAQFSEIPVITDAATRTLAALTAVDPEALSSATDVFAQACIKLGQ